MCLGFFLKNSFTVEKEGWWGTSLCFFFLLHLTCGRRRGSGLVFFQNFFSIVEWLGRGGGCCFFLQIHYEGLGAGCLEGGGGGRGLVFFVKLFFHY